MVVKCTLCGFGPQDNTIDDRDVPVPCVRRTKLYAQLSANVYSGRKAVVRTHIDACTLSNYCTS